MGEIENEFDLPSNELERVDEHTVEVAGSMTIDDFNETTGADAAAATGRARSPGSRSTPWAAARCRATWCEVDGAEIRIEEVEDLRITRLRIALSPAL